VVEARAAAMPMYADGDAPKADRPALCVVGAGGGAAPAPGAEGAATAYSCQASQQHMRRLCPCVGGAGGVGQAAGAAGEQQAGKGEQPAEEEEPPAEEEEQVEEEEPVEEDPVEEEVPADAEEEQPAEEQGGDDAAAHR